jgi:hypothetical protein
MLAFRLVGVVERAAPLFRIMRLLMTLSSGQTMRFRSGFPCSDECGLVQMSLGMFK